MASKRLKSGDIVAFWGDDFSSKFISFVTRGPSHVGIVCLWRGRLVLVESTTLCSMPCMYQGRCVSGVQAHQPFDRIHEYSGAVAVYPIEEHWTLDDEEKEFLSKLLDQFLKNSVRYDYGGALLSGTNILKRLTRFMPYADLGSLFCSEMVAFCYMRMGRLAVGNPALYDPATLVRAMRRSSVLEEPYWVKKP